MGQAGAWAGKKCATKDVGLPGCAKTGFARFFGRRETLDNLGDAMAQPGAKETMTSAKRHRRRYPHAR